MAAWFSIRLPDRPGSLGRLGGALGERGVNITGIVGVAEDTEGTLMLTISDEAAAREVFDALGLPYERHERATEASALETVRDGLARQGLDVEG